NRRRILSFAPLGERCRFRVESRCFDCMILFNRSFLVLETHTSFLTMKNSSLICRILITVGVVLSAPGLCFAQTNEWRQLFNGKDMKGWEQVGPGKFVVEDGKLKTVGGMGMLLYPAEKFGDVVLRVVYRSEERRVGEEGRGRGGAAECKAMIAM